MDASVMRHRVLANNIANVDTPYFKRSDVQFENLLQQELDRSQSTFYGNRTDPRHLYIGPGGAGGVKPAVVKDEFSVMNNNLNNVDIDREMSMVAENQLRYNTIVQQVNAEIKHLRTAIEGR